MRTLPPPLPVRPALAAAILALWALATPPAGAALEWVPSASPLPEPEWTVIVPSLPPVDGVRILATRPADFPRPAAVRGDERVELPFAREPALLERVESAGDAVLTWTARAEVHAGSGGVLAARLLPSGTAQRRPWSPWDGTPVPKERRLDTVRRQGWRTPVSRLRMARDPLRTRGPSPGAIEAVRDRLLPAVLVAFPLEATTGEVLAATTDGGSHWLALQLEAPDDSPEAVHELTPEEVLGVAGSAGGRLLVAPRPLGPRSEIDLLEVAPDGTVTSLGSVGRPQANWAQRVTSVREGADGHLEAVLLVHDLSWPLEARTDSWGAVIRRADDGTWSERVRFPLPAPDASARVLFGQQADELVLVGSSEPPRRLALPALGAVSP